MKYKEGKDLKKIYIILTYTGTLLSQVIKFYTKKEFSHVSIALDSELNQMYSFGRLNAYNPFFGGFVHENINSGTFKRFKNTISKIYMLEVEEKQYDNLKNYILQIQEQKDKYKFNILGLFAAGFNIRRKKKDAFYCAEFVKNALDTSNINIGLPEIVQSENFNKVKQFKEVYSGFLKNYNVENY